MQEHKRIDREIGDFAVGFDVAVAENAALLDAVVRHVQYVISRVVAVVVLAGFDLDRQNLSVLFDHKVELTEFLAVVVIQRLSVCAQLFCGDLFVNRAEVYRRFVPQYHHNINQRKKSMRNYTFPRNITLFFCTFSDILNNERSALLPIPPKNQCNNGLVQKTILILYYKPKAEPTQALVFLLDSVPFR